MVEVELGSRSSSAVGTMVVLINDGSGSTGVAGAPYFANENLSLFLEFFFKTSL